MALSFTLQLLCTPHAKLLSNHAANRATGLKALLAGRFCSWPQAGSEQPETLARLLWRLVLVHARIIGPALEGEYALLLFLLAGDGRLFVC